MLVLKEGTSRIGRSLERGEGIRKDATMASP